MQTTHNIYIMFNFATFFKTVQRTYVRFMTPRSQTQVLKCDPSAIVFHHTSDEPDISCLETLAAIKTASHHLVDLLQPVAFPTETVYGLGAVAHNSHAAARIFSTKGRPPDNPLIVHVSSLAMLNTLLPGDYSISRAYKALMKHFWPGALTFLFPRNPNSIPSIITADQPTVAIRMPSHTVARALIAISNVPLAAPSANSSGKPSPTRSEHVLRDLDGKIGIILDGGACGVGLESTVIDGLSEDGNIRVLRPGGVTVEDLERVLREELGDCIIPRVLVHRRDYLDETIEKVPTTPGMKYRHYSPSVPVTLLLTESRPPPDANSTPIPSFLASLKKSGASKIGVLAPADSTLWNYLTPTDGLQWCRYPLGLISEPSVTAHRLFDGLLTLEQEGVHSILIQEIKEDREGLAIMNRVRKAAGDFRWIAME
ncbi:translation factor [Tricholoma matsutake]|nr:translation factor [Tricholoma matsutake 945]